MKICGIVEHGKEKGRTIGFPTANLRPEEGAELPEIGVYASRVRIEGIEEGLIGITNVGQRPTADSDSKITIETYILDFTGNLYDRFMEVDVVEKIRGLHKFSGMEELGEQLKRDTETARRLLA